MNSGLNVQGGLTVGNGMYIIGGTTLTSGIMLIYRQLLSA